MSISGLTATCARGWRASRRCRILWPSPSRRSASVASTPLRTTIAASPDPERWKDRSADWHRSGRGEPLVKCFEVAPGFLRVHLDHRNAQPRQVRDEAGQGHLRNTCGACERKIAVTKQRRCQRRAHVAVRPEIDIAFRRADGTSA